MTVTIRNLDYLRSKDPKLLEIVKDIQQAVTNIQQGTTVSANPKDATLPPPQVTSLAVTAADGIFQAVIKDTGTVNKGVTYFLEFDSDPTFPQPHVIQLNAARTWRGSLGNLTTYWRAYSQYQGSMPSIPTTFGGSTPMAVVGGGSSGPALPTSTGSGTASQTGQQGGAGLGRNLVRQS